MATPKRGLSSWLHMPQTAVVATVPATAAATTISTTSTVVARAQTQPADAASPVDINGAIQRAKEAISRISPDKRTLVEEIDIDPDDAEFDEKAHWGRRSAAATAQRKKRKPSRTKPVASPGYSIKAFYAPQTVVLAEAVAATASAAAVALDSVTARALEALEFVAESAEEHSDELSGDTAVTAIATAEQPVGGEEDASSNSNAIGPPPTNSVDDLNEAIDSIDSSVCSSPIDTIASETEAEAETPSPVLQRPQQLAPLTTTTSGRPKRQVVLRAEAAANEQKALRLQRQLDDDLHTPTPPPTKRTAKLRATKSQSDAMAVAPRHRLAFQTPPPIVVSSSSGRKRKLEMEKSHSAPSSSSKSKPNDATSFFLTDSAKKQLREMEVIEQLKEQLRQARERDLAFHNGKTNANPFFHAPLRATTTSKEDTAAAAMTDSDAVEGASSNSSKRWSKDAAVLFPSIQHVISAADAASIDELQAANALFGIAKKRPVDALVVLDDETEENNTLECVLQAPTYAMDQQIDNETTQSDMFWFRQYSSDTASSTPSSVGLPQQQQFPCEWGSEAAVVDTLVELFNVREKRVRELLTTLDAARMKRLDKLANLTLADRYTPICASGVVGNKDALRLLSAWLSAWKQGANNSGSLSKSCFQQELCVFEGDASDSDDGYGDLCRLFVVQGASGAGKSAAVYACADEWGYNVIEINAGQSRTGRHIVELAGEATQSTRVLHVGTGNDKKSQKNQKNQKMIKNKRSRKSVDNTAAHLSLVLFEDVDVLFDDDKGFIPSLCSIAKHSKCPIVLTCRTLPDSFPATPQRLTQTLERPSVADFSTWLLLIAYLESLPLSPALVATLAQFFQCDVRRSLHFIETHAPQLAQQRQRPATWTWCAASSPSVEATGATTTATPVVVLDDDDVEDDKPVTAAVVVPAWTQFGLRGFDLLASNLLPELAAVCGSDAAAKPEDDKSKDEKVADALLIESLAAALDAASVADLWSHCDADDEDAFVAHEQRHLRALDVRAAGLAALFRPGGSGAAALERCNNEPPTAATCVRRSLDAALADAERLERPRALQSMQTKLELPLAALGASSASARFVLDYVPMLGRIGASSANQQQSRRRVSRRHHYLSDVVADLSLLDDIHAFTTFTYAPADSDQIVAASPSSSPLPF